MVELKIEELLKQKFEDPEWSDCFLLEISISPSRKVEITCDSDTGFTFEKCQKLSRTVENYLDTEGVLGEDYTLEVSSPGVTNPLVLPRQYPKHIGRTLQVKDTEGVEYEGELIAADATSIQITYESVRKEGKKKIKETMSPVFTYDKIAKAVVKLKF